MIKRVLAVSALASAGVLGVSVLPAGAGTIGPNVNLKDKGGLLKFAPKTLSLKAGKGTKCKATNYSFSLTNKSGSTETIDDGGSPFIMNMAPGQESFVCQGVGTIVYTVDGDPGPSLTVTVSA